MTDTKIYNGLVYLRKNDEKILLDGCVVKVWKVAPTPVQPTPEQLGQDITTSNGTFTIDFGAPAFENLTKVFISFEYAGGKTAKLAYAVNIENTDFTKKFEYTVLGEQRYSQRAGLYFFLFAIAGLCVTSLTYLRLHKTTSNNQPQETSISSIIDYTLKNITDTDSLGQSDLVISLRDTLGEEINSLLAQKSIDSTKFHTANLILQSIDQYTAINNHQLYRTSIQQMKRELDFFETSYLWQTKPMIFLEIFFWSLIATFLRMIVNTGYYLYIDRFIKSTIYYKLGLIFMVPIIAMVITLILSYINVEITLGESTGFNFNFKNAETVIIVAILIGLTPWGSWEFLEKLAKKFGKTMEGITGSNAQ